MHQMRRSFKQGLSSSGDKGYLSDVRNVDIALLSTIYSTPAYATIVFFFPFFFGTEITREKEERKNVVENKWKFKAK